MSRERTGFVKKMVLLLSATAACSTGDNRTTSVRIAAVTGGGAAATAAVVAPTTVTLAAPNGLSVIGPVLESANSVNVGAGVNVVSGTVVAMGSGGVSTQPGALLNDVWSEGRATLADRTNVRGTLFASAVSLGNGVIIHARNANPTFNPPSTLSWTVTYPSGTPTDVTVNSNQTSTLKPGLWGAVTVNSQGTLNLSAGTYFLSALTVNAGTTVSLDQTNGAVIIYVTGNLVLNGALSVKGGGQPDLLIGYLSGNALNLNGPFVGAVVAPFATLTFNGGSYTGFFAAANVVVQANARITYQAPNAIATAVLGGGANSGGGSPLQVCANLIVPPSNLTGIQQNDAYQAAIARFCSMPGTPQCITTLVGRANADYTAAALQVASQTMTPAQYLALSRDRTRKLFADRQNVALGNALCAGPDSDGDWIIDANDKCPNTPDLTATDDNGCPTALPPGPSPADVQQVLNGLDMAVNPLCNGAPPPAQMAGAAFFQTANPGLGNFIVSSRVTNQPAGCPVWYSFQVRELAAPGVPVGAPMSVVFQDSEATSPVGDLAGEPAVPPTMIQFLARPTDPGTRGVLGGIPETSFGISFRVQAVNGNGVRGPWSEWKIPTEVDCLQLGVVCGHR